MGEGPVEQQHVPEEVRVIRHNVRNLQGAVNGWGSMVQTAAAKADGAAAEARAAQEMARTARESVRDLEADIFGGKPGRVGAMHNLEEQITANAAAQRAAMDDLAKSLRAATVQNWAIIIGMLGVVATMILVFITHTKP